MLLLIIGERINSSIKIVEDAIKNRNSEAIKNEVSSQIIAGANVIDLNAGTLINNESEALTWLINNVNNVPEFNENISIALDSSNPKAIEVGLEEIERLEIKQKTIVNSITGEEDKNNRILTLVGNYQTKVIGLCMDATGISGNPEHRCEIGVEIIKKAKEYGIPKEDVYLDPLILPVSTDIQRGIQALDTLKGLKAKDPEILTVIGLSNISYGLPKRELLNRAFMVLALSVGIDGAILNPQDKRLMNIIKATETILGMDEYCMNYISAFRKGEFI